jgi:hypothetical protein
MRTKKNSLIVLLTFILLVLSACTPETPVVSGGNTGSPEDTNMYVIRGRVISDVDSLTRQVTSASGAMYGNYAHYTGPVVDGKSFIRISLMSANPNLPDAEIGQVILIKVVDTKAQALLPKDVVTFKCRRQYEAVARLNSEEIDWKKQETWEIDECRLASIVLSD